MNYEELKEEVKQIAEIAGSVPEPFRDKCFELLLSNLIGKQAHVSKGTPTPAKLEAKEPDSTSEDKTAATQSNGATSTFPMTTQLRLFMRKTAVTNDELDKILMYDKEGEGNVHFIKEPHDIQVITGQMEWALLLALKKVILKDSLSVDPEDVRSVCQDKGFYDLANFAANFKKPKYSKLFKGSMVSQGAAQQLSNDGQDELGKLIKRLASLASESK